MMYIPDDIILEAVDYDFLQTLINSQVFKDFISDNDVLLTNELMREIVELKTELTTEKQLVKKLTTKLETIERAKNQLLLHIEAYKHGLNYYSGKYLATEENS